MSSDGQDALDAMSSEFIAEIKDDLVSLEPALLTMEEKGIEVDDDLINHAFRSIHSIKGGAGFINFQELSSLSHAMENVLMLIREKKLIITSDVVDALLAGFDKMKFLVEVMGTDQDCDYEKEKQVLESIAVPSIEPKTKPLKKVKATKKPKISIKKASSNAKTKEIKSSSKNESSIQVVKPLSENGVFQDKMFEIDKSRLDHALKSQKFVYAVHIRFENDLTSKQRSQGAIIEDINSIGDILYSDLDKEKSAQSKSADFFCVIATILDLPLLSQVLEINKMQMTLVDRQFTDFETILNGQTSKSVLKATAEEAVKPDKSSGKPAEKPARKPSGKPAGGQQTAKKSEEEHKQGAMVSDPQILSSSTSQTIRINVDLISRLMNRAGELVLSRNQLRPFMDQFSNKSGKASHMMQNLDMVTSDIQEAIMQMRMQPIIDLMGKYKRVVRDIARRISKKVDFVVKGAEVEVDRNVLEKLANPVTHLIRNCIDHGIEFPEERVAQSKPERGTIHIHTYHQGGHVHIDISDDGAGIDPQLVLSKAFEKGLVTEDQLDKLSDQQKINLIFMPGFSTSEEITDISGRGVGMDVVKTNIERLRGHIEIDSVKGKGTIVHLIIPLTLAIVPSLIVGAGEFKYAIPQVSIKEIIYLEPGKIHEKVEHVAGSEVLKLRGNLLPILRLRNILDIITYIESPDGTEKRKEQRTAIADRRQKYVETEKNEKRSPKKDRRNLEWDAAYIITLKLGKHVFGLCVDELYDIEEVVVEPLSEYLKYLKYFAGATILGDGDVIMILDVPGIASMSSLKFETIKTEELKRTQSEDEKKVEKGRKRNLIIFGNTNKEYFALELKDVSRLEPIRPADIHHTGNLKYIEYNNNAVLLFSMDEFLPASQCDFDQKEIFAIFPKKLSSQMGVLASTIIDTVEITEELNQDSTCSQSVMGKVFIDEMMVQVLDHETFIELIENKAKETKEPGYLEKQFMKDPE